MSLRSLLVAAFITVGCCWSVGEAVLAHPKSPAVPKATERHVVDRAVANFVLTDQDKRPFESKSRLSNKVVVLAFGYTTCPDICPFITAAMRQVQSQLSANEFNGVQFVTITTDPEIDSPDLLAAYAKRYRVDHRNWAFLTGTDTALKRVWRGFGVTVERKARGLIDHTSLTVVIDRNGRMRFVYAGSSPDPKAILQDVRSLL